VADVAAAPGAGLSAGVYLAFPAFVMPGLRKLPPAHAISAMSSTSKAAPGNPLLMLVLSGTGIVCVLVMIAGFQHKGDPAAALQMERESVLLHLRQVGHAAKQAVQVQLPQLADRATADQETATMHRLLRMPFPPWARR
jgi:uncharacterized membrane protein